jgi:hypothetical protein
MLKADLSACRSSSAPRGRYRWTCEFEGVLGGFGAALGCGPSLTRSTGYPREVTVFLKSHYPNNFPVSSKTAGQPGHRTFAPTFPLR